MPEEEIKIRTTISFVKEFTTTFSRYPDDCKTVEQILAYEKAIAEEEPLFFVEESKMSISIERIP